MGGRPPICLLVIILLLSFAFSDGNIEAQTSEPIKIGAFFALSGPSSSIATSTSLAAQMVVDKINEDQGINGRSLELIVGDTEGDPSRALALAKRLVEEDKVSALIGPTHTGTGMTVKSYIETKAHIPAVMTVEGDRVIAGGKYGPYRWTFKIPPRTSTAVRKIYGYLNSQKLRKVGLLTASDGFGKEGLGWLEKLAPEYGLEIVARESFDPTAADVTAQIGKIGASDPQALVCWTIGPAGARVAKSLKRSGMTIPLIQSHRQPGPQYTKLAGAAAEGSIMPTTKLMVYRQLPNIDPQKAVIQDFVNLYRDVHHLDEQCSINVHSGYAWDAIFLLTNAMRQVGPEAEPLRDAIEQMQGYVGVSGVYKLTPEDHNGLGGDSLVMVKVENGKWVMIQH